MVILPAKGVVGMVLSETCPSTGHSCEVASARKKGGVGNRWGRVGISTMAPSRLYSAKFAEPPFCDRQLCPRTWRPPLGGGDLSEGGVEGHKKQLALQVPMRRPESKVGGADGGCNWMSVTRWRVPGDTFASLVHQSQPGVAQKKMRGVS